MGAWAGPYAVASLLLVLAGLAKARDPRTTAGAFRTMGLRVPEAAVRAGGGLEAGLGVVALTGVAWVAALVALSYLAFSGFVAVALVRGLPIGSCGCFGKVDTPPSVLHLVVNGGAIVAASAVALGASGGFRAVLADQPAFGVPFLAFVVAATYLAYLALTVLPQLDSLRRAGRRASSS